MKTCWKCGKLIGDNDSRIWDGGDYRHMNGGCPVDRPLYVSERIYNQLRTKGSIRLAR